MNCTCMCSRLIIIKQYCTVFTIRDYKYFFSVKLNEDDDNVIGLVMVAYNFNDVAVVSAINFG